MFTTFQANRKIQHRRRKKEISKERQHEALGEVEDKSHVNIRTERTKKQKHIPNNTKREQKSRAQKTPYKPEREI